MPKAKPDQVITHRIELGTWERNNLQGQLEAKTINEAAGAVQKIGLTVVAGGALYVAWFVLDELYGWIEKAADAVGAVTDVFDRVTMDSEERYDTYRKETGRTVPATMLKWMFTGTG